VAAIPTGTTGKYASIHPADRRLVGLNGAADMLGLSRAKVHLLVQEGEFETLRIGRRLLITVESIDAFIERLRRDQEMA
jgi:excisionase family DNA binding protein